MVDHKLKCCCYEPINNPISDVVRIVRYSRANGHEWSMNTLTGGGGLVTPYNFHVYDDAGTDDGDIFSIARYVNPTTDYQHYLFNGRTMDLISQGDVVGSANMPKTYNYVYTQNGQIVFRDIASGSFPGNSDDGAMYAIDWEQSLDLTVSEIVPEYKSAWSSANAILSHDGSRYGYRRQSSGTERFTYSGDLTFDLDQSTVSDLEGFVQTVPTSEIPGDSSSVMAYRAGSGFTVGWLEEITAAGSWTGNRVEVGHFNYIAAKLTGGVLYTVGYIAFGNPTNIRAWDSTQDYEEFGVDYMWSVAPSSFDIEEAFFIGDKIYVTGGFFGSGLAVYSTSDGTELFDGPGRGITNADGSGWYYDETAGELYYFDSDINMELVADQLSLSESDNFTPHGENLTVALTISGPLERRHVIGRSGGSISGGS